MTDFVAYHDVECVFAMSGQYGRAPRGLYYGLLLFVVLLKRQDWLTAGAAAACLTFGGSAGIHALILAPIYSLGYTSVPNEIVTLSNGTSILVAPLATDLDSDATLAMVGTGFLIAVTMALWSARFKLSGAVPILVLWICLMSIGMIASLTNLYAIDGSATGPLKQFRFCSPDYNDTLPTSSNPISIVNNSWNETIWTHFNRINSEPKGCYYPCLEGTNLLRQPGDATAIQFLDIGSSGPLFWGLQIISAIVYGCVSFSILFCFVILVLRLCGGDLVDWDFSYQQVTVTQRLVNFSTGAINVYAKMTMYFIFPVFLVWIEWVIYYDLQSESMQVVGQWAPLVGAGLAFVAAVVGKYWDSTIGKALLRRRNIVVTPKLKHDLEYDTSTVWSQVGSVNFKLGE